jgi:aminotransferase
MKEDKAMALTLSSRTQQLVQADIRAMSIECERVGGINLAQGVCDTEVPPPVARGAQLAISQGFNTYTRFDGLRELRQAIAQKLLKYNGIEADPDSEIIVCSGSTGAFYCACMALLDPGDEVVMFEPYYSYHVNTILAVGAIPRYVTLYGPQWTFTPEDLEKVINPKTKAIVVNTPANPSGKVFSRTELEWIADAACRYDLFVFTDEIYEYFLYDGRVHISPASLPGMADRTITISGFSKVFSITGWRIGYSISARRWAQMIGYVNDLVYVCAPAPLQYGVALGIEELNSEFYRFLQSQYMQKRDRICKALERAGLTPFIPQGAYYVLADIARIPGETSRDKAMYLLYRAGVAGVPGAAFFHNGDGENLIRFCFAKNDAELEEACQRLEELG